MSPDPSLPPAGAGPILIVQPLPGIGDMIWHLPVLRAIAAACPDHDRVLLAKRRARAKDLFAADPAVTRVVHIEDVAGRDGWGAVPALAEHLAGEAFSRAFVLHKSGRYAVAAMLARIPERFGYGLKPLGRFAARSPFLPFQAERAHPIEKMHRYMALTGLDRHALPRAKLLPDASLMADQAFRFSHLPKPWIALGVGSSEPYKQWGEERFAALTRCLLDHSPGPGTVFLLGGPPEAPFEASIRAGLTETQQGRLAGTFNWPIKDVIALQAACALYAGNDTGFLNIAASLHRPAIGFFAATPVLSFSPSIIPLLPVDGSAVPYTGDWPKDDRGLMDKIGVDRALDAILSALDTAAVSAPQ